MNRKCAELKAKYSVELSRVADCVTQLSGHNHLYGQYKLYCLHSKIMAGICNCILLLIAVFLM